MVILAHHEIFIQLLQYGLSLILGGYICFKHLFPMLGRWIVDFNRKMQNRILKLKEEEVQRGKDRIKRFEDDQCVIDGLYMDQGEIEKAYRGTRMDEYFETESQINKILSKKQEQQDPNKDGGVIGAPWLIQPK